MSDARRDLTKAERAIALAAYYQGFHAGARMGAKHLVSAASRGEILMGRDWEADVARLAELIAKTTDDEDPV